jgi:hypothetical protein
VWRVMRTFAQSNQRLHLTRAPYGELALDCFLRVFSGLAASSIRRGRSRAGETLIR